MRIWLALFAAAFGISVAATIGLISARPAFPRDRGQWADVSPERQLFFRGLTDRLGVGCCSDADGFEAEDWDPFSNRVKVEGSWYEIPESAQLNKRNPYGAARAWIGTRPDGSKFIRCFIGGNLG